MRTGSYNVFYAVAIEYFNIHMGCHLKGEFVTRTFCWITGAPFLTSKYGKVHLTVLEDFGKGSRDFFCSIIKTPRILPKRVRLRIDLLPSIGP